MVLNRLEEFFNLQENIRACFDMVLKLLVKCSGAQATSKAICWITEPDDNFPRELGKKDTALEVRLGSLEKSSLDKLSQGGNSLSLLSYLFLDLDFSFVCDEIVTSKWLIPWYEKRHLAHRWTVNTFALNSVKRSSFKFLSYFHHFHFFLYCSNC